MIIIPISLLYCEKCVFFFKKSKVYQQSLPFQEISSGIPCLKGIGQQNKMKNVFISTYLQVTDALTLW